ncbi:DUF2326 domain-containing protein [Paraburkholderia sp. Tr-20389]|uniref:DUF2326 domain-containing protein n=1 Tax=Paraburkholderia sp. Tr-20389 TaxID=2703903 RepID=UPI00197F3AC8|nr:DUF2326 domain-containing protein [Paraburkholderia sp. Tr-20389]MBN3756097.1 DUF2326 domain-containing protein [Paraburkholderia sp. Tr-20389]
MLRKIICPFFNHGEISFHAGLNIVLGDDDARNSIGKSLALLVIDFAMGGISLQEDKAGAIASLGHHAYSIEFNFDNTRYFFKRATDASDLIQVCDENYSVTEEITVDVYRAKLKSLYDLDQLKSSFRSLVGPFSRIWNKGALEPEHPFSADPKESAAVAVERLIDFFERIAEIEREKAVLDANNERKRLISKSMSVEIIPKINKTQYKANQKTIADNAIVIESLKQGFAGALSAYEALFDEGLRVQQQRKNQLNTEREELRSKIDRVNRDLAGVAPRLSANISLVTEFFPDVNVKRLEQVEAFHQNISNLVKKELKKELTQLSTRESDVSAEIGKLENTMRADLAAKGTPDDLFARVFELKEVADNAAEENRFFDQKLAIDKETSLSKERLGAIYVNIFLAIETAINEKLKRFNKVVYDPKRNASQLRIKSANSYSFTSPVDTGTGKSYAGLVGFDLAMLSLTRLPFIIHDSVIYKNIEVPATRHILRILAAVQRKQIFLAFDEAAKFGPAAEGLLRSHTVLKLSHDDLLYIKDWRAQQ